MLLTLYGKSENKYKFRKTDFDISKMPACGGVYVVGKITNENKIRPIYIGQAGDIQHRHKNHEREQCWKNHNADYFAVLNTDDMTQGMDKDKEEEYRCKIENDIIEVYNPVCNRK